MGRTIHSRWTKPLSKAQIEAVLRRVVSDPLQRRIALCNNAASLQAAGLSIPLIAQELEVCGTTVSNLLREHDTEEYVIGSRIAGATHGNTSKHPRKVPRNQNTRYFSKSGKLKGRGAYGKGRKLAK